MAQQIACDQCGATRDPAVDLSGWWHVEHDDFGQLEHDFCSKDCLARWALGET
jgi:hypothetical protein